MSATTLIPEHIEDDLLTRAGEINPVSLRRWTHRELAKWLRDKHGVECSHMTVGRCLTKLRRDRRALLGEAIGEALLTSLQDDWAALDLERERLASEIANVDPVKQAKSYVALLGEMRKIAATKAATIARVTGDGDDEVTLKGSGKSLADFLATAFNGRSNPSGTLGE